MTPSALVADAAHADGTRAIAGERPPDLIRTLLASAREHLDFDVAVVCQFVKGRYVCRFVDGDRRALEGGLDEDVGVPLQLPDGRIYGALHFACRTPQPSLSKRDGAVIRVLARVIADELGRREVQAIHRRRVIERIERVLDQDRLAIVFQPIVDLQTGDTLGFEALAQFISRPHKNPEAWFAEAGQVGLGAALEVAAIRAALAHLADLPDHTYLSLNVSPRVALTPEFAEALDGIPAERLAIELTEHARIDDYRDLTEALEGLRDRGARLMIDDVGAGFANLHHILRLAPDAIKLDRSLTSGIHADPARRALAAALVTFGRHTGAATIAEGIETEAELATLREVGVQCGQGFYLGRPGPILSTFHAPAGALRPAGAHLAHEPVEHPT